MRANFDNAGRDEVRIRPACYDDVINVNGFTLTVFYRTGSL